MRRRPVASDDDFDVEPGDPHNDQLVARAREDLSRHIDAMRELLTESDRTTAIVIAAVTMEREAVEAMPRSRLAALLATAVERLTPDPEPRPEVPT